MLSKVFICAGILHSLHLSQVVKKKKRGLPGFCFFHFFSFLEGGGGGGGRLN